LITAYVGSAARNSIAVSGKKTAVRMTGLSGGTGYAFRVVASNAYGDGPAASSGVVTPSGSATTYASSVLASGPVAYYRLGEGSGQTAADSSGRGQLGAYDQATLGVAGAVGGDPDGAVGANGGCCVARVAPSGVLPQGNAARSVEAWVKPADGYGRYLAGWGTAAVDRAFSVYVQGNLIVVVGYGDDRTFTAGHTTADGAWHHVVVTYDGTTLAAYLDGQPIGSHRFAAALNTLNRSGLVIGADFQGSAPFYGSLDELAVYPTALTASQVAAHFTASGRPAPTTTGSAAPSTTHAAAEHADR
jgi:hypothetical protein